MSSSNNDSSRTPKPDDIDGDESRLSRWSRRKRQSGHERNHPADPVDSDENKTSDNSPVIEEPEQSGVAAQSDEAEKAVNGASASEQVRERELTDADMPDIDSLTPDSDFKPFMSKGVSHALRRKALRKLFASPFFQIRDGLDDYDDDFTSFAPLGDTVTADMKYAQEYKEKLRLEAEQERQEKLQAQRAKQLKDGELDEGESNKKELDEDESREQDHELTDAADDSEPQTTESSQIDQHEPSADDSDEQARVATTQHGDSQSSIDSTAQQPARPQPHSNVRGGPSVDDVDEFDEEV